MAVLLVDVRGCSWFTMALALIERLAADRERRRGICWARAVVIGAGSTYAVVVLMATNCWRAVVTERRRQTGNGHKKQLIADVLALLTNLFFV